MTAAQAVSMPTLPFPPASTGNRPVQQDSQGSSDAGWQRALETASQDVHAPSALTAEAGYLMTLNNLDVTPMEALPLPSTMDHTPRDLAPELDGTVAKLDHAETDARQPSLHLQHDAKASSTTRPAPDRPLDTQARTEPASTSKLVLDVVEPASTTGRAGRASMLRRASSVEADRPSAPMLPRTALQSPTAHAIATYATAMSSAPVSTEASADFTIAAHSITTPVRVHVQWRDRVADVWIGLHRKAFDQLPDIRSGVEDWVTSRGGVLGRVVCNGETLTRIAPSSNFLGAL